METTDEKHAIAILGRGKVVTVGEVVQAWERRPSQSPVTQFSRKILAECAEKNKKGTDWRLVYVLGISLPEQREIRGSDDCRQPCFKEGNGWWLRESEGFWAGKQGKSGYYLLDFHLRFTDMSWRDQNEAIAALGSQYERTHERTVAEAVLSIFMTSCERLLEGDYHWGCSSTRSDSLVAVGKFDSRGLFVDTGKPLDSYPNVGVVLSRKP